MDGRDIYKLERHLGRLGDCAVENEMKINPGKRKTVSFTRDRVKDPLNYSFRDQNIPEESSFK
jgi:hypothetical protein